MASSPDKSESLRRLLALKRHETPPPGFFDQLPRAVRARLEAQPEAVGWWTGLLAWLRLEWSFKPALAGAMLAAAAGLYVVEVIQHPASPPAGWAAEQGAPDPYSGLAVVPMVLSNSPSPLFADEGRGVGDRPSSLQPRLGSEPPPGLFRPGAGLNLRPTPAAYSAGATGAFNQATPMIASNTPPVGSFRGGTR